ncbi:MAG: glycosyltransferase family 2 protein [Candidatus Omnitrophota bacterium]
MVSKESAKMEIPRITAVIPTYKRPQSLKKTICSVLDQTYPFFRICVYDNASGDETGDMVFELAQKDDRIEYHCHNANIGALKNFHFGIGNVKTKYFSIICDDDFLLPDCYEVCIKELLKYPEAMFCSVGTAQIVEDRKIAFLPIMKWKEGVHSPPDGFLQIAKKGQPIWTGTLYRSEVIRKIGNLDAGTMGSSDLDFALKISAKSSFVISKKVCAVYRNHTMNVTAKRGLDDIWPDFRCVIKNVHQSNEIPFDVIQKAEYFLYNRLKRKMFCIFIKALESRDYFDSIKIADVFREYLPYKRMASLLFIIARVNAKFPVFTVIFFWIRCLKWSFLKYSKPGRTYIQLSNVPEIKKYL